MASTDELYRQYAIEQGWLPPDAGPATDATAIEAVPPPPPTGATADLNFAIPAGAVDAGAPPPPGGPPPNVRQPTMQIVNGAPVGKTPDQMTDAEYADYLEAQGAVMPTGKPTLQRPQDAAPPPPAGYVTAQDNTRNAIYADVNKRAAEADAEKDAIAKANTGGGAPPAGGRGGGPMVVPGGWKRTVSGDVLQGFDALQTQRAQGAQDREIEARLVNQAYAQHLEERGAQLQAEQEAQAAELERQRQAQQKAQGDYDAAAKAAREAHVDPKRFFGDDAGTTILAVIGSALGGLGAALTGGPNQAMAMINAAIDRDIKAQESALLQKKGAADNALGRLRDETGNLSAAKMAYKQAALGYAQNQMDRLGATAKDAELRNALSAELENQVGQSLDFRMKTEQFIPPRVVGGAPSAADKDLDKIFEGPDGSRYVAPNKETRDKLAAGAASIASFKKYANQLDELRNDPMTYVPGTEQNAKAKTLGQKMVFESKSAEDLGAISKDDREMVENTLGDPTGLTSRAGQKAKTYGDLLDDRYKATLRANVVNQVQTGNKLDQRGQLAPTAVYTGKSPTAPKPPPPGFKPVQ